MGLRTLRNLSEEVCLGGDDGSKLFNRGALKANILRLSGQAAHSRWLALGDMGSWLDHHEPVPHELWGTLGGFAL